MAIKAADLPRIRQLIRELNNIAQTRKNLLDQLWTLENHGENLRNTLMRLLDSP